MYNEKINVSYELFEQDDFEEYEDRITELLLENREMIEEAPYDILDWLNQELYFCDDLEYNMCDVDDVLCESVKERIYDCVCDEQRCSLDNFLTPLKNLIKKLKLNIPKMIENE